MEEPTFDESIEFADENELVLIEQMGEFILLRGLFHSDWQFLQVPRAVFDEITMDIVMDTMEDKEEGVFLSLLDAAEIAFHVLMHIHLEEHGHEDDGDDGDGSPFDIGPASKFRSVRLGDERKN